MKKVLAGLAVALVLGSTLFVSTQNPQPDPAEAEATSAFMLPKSTCVALFTGAIGGIALGCLDTPAFFQANLNIYAEDIGDKDGELEPEDLTAVQDFGGRQLHEDDGYAFIVVFVNDQAPVRFRIDNDGGAFNVGNNTIALNQNEFICNGTHDSDCNETDDADDNGIVIIGLCSGADSFGCDTGLGARTADRGEHRISIDQEQVPVDIDYTVVGEADEISLTVFESTISNGIVDLSDPADGDTYDSDECPLAASVAGFTAALNEAPKTVVIGRAVDSDGQGITSAWIGWDTDDHEIADFTGTRETPTLNLGSFGFGAPQILCGTEKPGVVELQAHFVKGPPGPGVNLDRAADEDVDITFDVTVRGVPASMEVAVTPATLTCDGVASAEVSATVKDANGDLVANGTQVNWSVQVLGTAAPLRSTTTDGIAKTTVIPLSGSNRGVPAVATSGDVQGSVLVNCGPSAGAPPPAPGAGAPGGGAAPGGGGTIGGPDTGSGGYLSGGDGSLPMWPALPMLAALGLMVWARARAGARR